VRPGLIAATAIVALAGALPIVAAHAAYLMNLWHGGELPPEFVCMPYLDGCVSVSRAARSGPGLLPFRWLMLTSAPLLLLTWALVRRWLRDAEACGGRKAWTMAALGMAGAVFLVLYVTALGNESEWYNWQRRYGVTVYFGGTALAQLLLVWVLWPARRNFFAGRLGQPVAVLTALVSLQWALGVCSAVKRLIFTDPLFIDRLENVIEWWYALAMSLAFFAVAWLFAHSRRSP
jgi:hypothetical protein